MVDENTGATGLITLGSLIPLVGIVAMAIYLALTLRKQRSDRKAIYSTLITIAPHAVLLIVFLVFSAIGGCTASFEPLAVSTALVAESGYLALKGVTVNSKLANLSGKHIRTYIYVRDTFILIAVIAIGFLVLETPWNDRLTSLRRTFAAIDLFVVSIPLLAFYCFGGGNGIALALPLTAWSIIGLAQYFVNMFKQTAIVPSDLLALGTALSVSGGYAYELGTAQVLALALLSVGLCLLAYMIPLRKMAKTCKTARNALGSAPGKLHSQTKRWQLLTLRAAGGIAILFVAACLYSTVNLTDHFGYTNNYWDTLNIYKDQGMAGSFISLLQNSHPQEPEGYTEEAAENTLATRVQLYDQTWGATESRRAAEQQFIQTKPTVITIMNESFADLSIFNGLNSGYPGPTLLKGIGDALYTGTVYTSVSGGSTCNSEFEFLSNITLKSVGTQNQPYVMFDLEQIDSLPRQLSNNGYSTTAIHPNLAANWNRSSAYGQLGFDEFLDITSFAEDAPTRHAGITDAATYEKVLEVLNSSDAPQFIFDVTMQNHGGYQTFDLSEEERLPYDLSWLVDIVATETSEYISLINTSEQELMAFMDQLRSINRPVVLVFFGDHQPYMASTVNDALFPASDEAEQTSADGTPLAEEMQESLAAQDAERIYQTPYLIWANYDVAGNDQVSEHRDLGLNALSALMLQAIGAPLTDMQKATLSTMDEVPIYNSFGYQTSDGMWHLLDGATETANAVRDLEWIQHLEGSSKL